MNLLERIKKLCNQRGISVYQLEEKIEIGRNTIYQWNKRTPSTEKIQKVADYFDVSVDYLLGREEKETPKHVDLSEDDTVFSFDGKEISKETMRKAIAIAKALEENE
ncbi:helix-turn-helix domain-containing protein [Enterococcus faecium]|uniref:helix-turn-helix domain-containing protein n=1 Tax=Enterococcus faecium TaxID=1352 RepID=UPI0002A45CF1|nr:helix-turn-helix transcriptional regulator [Enterococcus faecium]ELB42658.1 helix-turn-helix protein [Enterococcus faecium EnGen0044]